MAIGSLPPVTNKIQANSGQPGKTLAQQTAASSLLDLQAAISAEPSAAIIPETTLLERAVAEALGRQGGLASLYATLTELAKAPDLPDSVKAAVNTLLSFRLDEGDVTPERIAQAIRSSGVFHEAVAAGNMPAALPPAVRQALGGPPADNVQVAARPAISSPAPATSTPATRPASSPQPQSSSNVGTPASGGTPAAAAQAYGRLGGLSAPAAASSVPEAPATAAVVTPNTTSPAAIPETAAASSSNRTVPAGPAFTQTAAASVPLLQSAGALVQQGSAGEVPVAASPTAPSPLGNSGPPSPPDTGRDAPVSAQPQLLPAEPVETLPTSPAAKDVLSKATSSVASEIPAALAEKVAAPGAAIPAPTGERPPALVTSAQPGTVPAGEAPSQQALPAHPSGEAPTTRSFAPWTPGRPLTVASQAPADTPAVPAQQPAPAASSPATAPPATEAGLSRPAGDRAPFVPSVVESLPNAQPGVVASKAPAGPAPALPAQVATTPGVSQPSEHVPDSVSPQAPKSSLPTATSTQTSAEPVQPAAPSVRMAAAPLGAVPEVPARLNAPQAAAPSMIPAELGLDLKGALDLLRRELVTWLGRNADVMASLDGASDDGTAPRVDRPQPPRKGGPVRGQPAVAPPGSEEADSSSTETLAGRALGEAERSLSRVFLHQAVTAESRDSKTAQVAQAFVMEIPIAGPNGTSIAQLRIERDDHAPSEPGAPPRRVFQVDIAFDIAPLGPVAVRVGLMDGRRVAVGVWCESDDGLVRMEAERENIVLGLEQEGMVVAGVDLHRGHPPEGHEDATIVPSHRLDLQL